MEKYVEHDLYIQRFNEDGSVSFIPKDDGNKDYQEYLNPSEAAAE